jgi:hypothetical protein
VYTNERKTNINKQRRMKIRKENILIDNTKQLTLNLPTTTIVAQPFLMFC